MAAKSINKKLLEGIDDVIFISDIHFGAKAASTEWMENMIGYFDNFFFPLVRNEISDGRHPIIVIAGDFFDNRHHIDINILNKSMDVMEKMSALCPVYVMTGNHDIYKKNDTDVTSLRVFKNIDNVTVVPDMLVLDIDGKRSFLLVSWIGDFTKESKLVTKYKSQYDYIVLHTEISGMSYDNNRPIVNGVNLSAIENKCRVVSGHIHKRQEGKSAMYLGSPYMMTKSDIGNEKGIYCFRIENDGNVNVSFTQNDYSPKYIKCNFLDYGKNASEWADVVRNNYVEIVFELEDIDKFNTNKFVDELQAYNPRKIELSVHRKETGDSDKEHDLGKEWSVVDVFVDRISERGLSETQVKNIIKMNNEYIKKANEELAK